MWGLGRRRTVGPATFASAFGGLWIDRSDFAAELAARRRDGRLDAGMAARVKAFAAEGFTILPAAVPEPVIDAFADRIARAFRDGEPSFLVQAHGTQVTRPLEPGVDRLGSRVVDAYMASPEALDIFAQSAISGFFRAIFDDDPLLFQSLSFDQGSQQGLHQDTAYVVVDRPLELAAVWVALEDVAAGSGELIYVPGSHRLGDFDFGGRKHWDPGRDGPEPHDRFSQWLLEEPRARGMEVRSFLPRKGDALVWHADLAHGGRPVVDPTLTRRSLVGHLCPASRSPAYFAQTSDRAEVHRHGTLRYASYHYPPEMRAPAG